MDGIVATAGSGHGRAYDCGFGAGFGSEAGARRETVAPVGIRCFRHEGIVVTNQQRHRGLEWLAGAWELASADGRVLSAPAELPGLCPGETAAVPLPFALPRDGGDMWLTLRVTATEDEPWAPYGTEVCAPRVRLSVTAARAGAGPQAPATGEPVRQPGRVLHLDLVHRGLLKANALPARGGTVRRRPAPPVVSRGELP
jgi:hypothetical protein